MSNITKSIIYLLDKRVEDAKNIEDGEEKAKVLMSIIDEYKALINGVIKK